MYIYIYIHIYIYISSCLRPSRHSAYDVRLVGWMAGWLNGWLIALLLGANFIKSVPKSIKLWCKILQNRGVGGLGGSWWALGRVLGPSWPQDGSKSVKNLEKLFLGPPLGSQVGAQNQPKSVPRAIRKAIIFLIDWKIDFWSDLVQLDFILDPKTLPKWSQVGSKIDPSWTVGLTAVFWWMLGPFLLNFQHNMTWPK